MAHPYFELTKVKLELGITATNHDTLLNNMGEESDSDIDREIRRILASQRNRTTLPDVPLSTIPQSVKDWSTNNVIAKIYLKKQRVDMQTAYSKQADKYRTNFIDDLDSKSEVWGRKF
ncbi:MAG: phage head-tail connector protein [Thaumarchaeota archaeon]|nr:phage head-tail connector protein [Nitrososphaerota archaeon]